MGVLKADILTFVNNVLREAFTGTQLDEEIKTCLADLSKANLLVGTATNVLTVGDVSVALPTDFKQEVSIVPSLADVNYSPLKPFPGGFTKLQDAMTGTPTGLPEYYTIFNKTMYLYPAASSAYTLTTSYYKHHAKTVDAITFGDDFSNAINFGSAYYAALFRKKSSYIEIWRPIYEEEKAKMIALTPTQPHIIRGLI
ncbi:MAG: hypothetical protein WC356_03560 [Candidatus Micrarchaeia archaeon]|jgi:hypothetical protein